MPCSNSTASCKMASEENAESGGFYFHSSPSWAALVEHEQKVKVKVKGAGRRGLCLYTSTSIGRAAELGRG